MGAEKQSGRWYRRVRGRALLYGGSRTLVSVAESMLYHLASQSKSLIRRKDYDYLFGKLIRAGEAFGVLKSWCTAICTVAARYTYA